MGEIQLTANNLYHSLLVSLQPSFQYPDFRFYYINVRFVKYRGLYFGPRWVILFKRFTLDQVCHFLQNFLNILSVYKSTKK